MIANCAQYAVISLCMASLRTLAVALAMTVHASADKLPADRTHVDLAIVLAADVSASMTEEEVVLQRKGYAEALISPDVRAAIRRGYMGRIAVTYIEWSSEGAARVIVKWTIIDDSASIAEVAETIRTSVTAASRRGRGGRTSISYALSFSTALFDQLPWASARRVIDISGDGINNDGGPVGVARSAALDAGIAINGLPIGNDAIGGETISQYYAREVIGGYNAFVEPAASVGDFRIALERKLEREIANLDPQAIPAPWMTGTRASVAERAIVIDMISAVGDQERDIDAKARMASHVAFVR